MMILNICSKLHVNFFVISLTKLTLLQTVIIMIMVYMVWSNSSMMGNDHVELHELTQCICFCKTDLKVRHFFFLSTWDLRSRIGLHRGIFYTPPIQIIKWSTYITYIIMINKGMNLEMDIEFYFEFGIYYKKMLWFRVIIQLYLLFSDDMSELQAILEFLVEFHKFYNVDLFQRG